MFLAIGLRMHSSTVPAASSTAVEAAYAEEDCPHRRKPEDVVFQRGETGRVSSLVRGQEWCEDRLSTGRKRLVRRTLYARVHARSFASKVSADEALGNELEVLSLDGEEQRTVGREVSTRASSVARGWGGRGGRDAQQQ